MVADLWELQSNLLSDWFIVTRVEAATLIFLFRLQNISVASSHVSRLTAFKTKL